MVESEKENSLIYSYTAEQAVEDGVLLEVDPELREEAGYRWAVRITQGVASLTSAPEMLALFYGAMRVRRARPTGGNHRRPANQGTSGDLSYP